MVTQAKRGRVRHIRPPKLHRVQNYQPPGPESPAFRRRPFSGKRVRQRVSQDMWLEGRLLVSQCQATTAALQQRCRRTTGYDYQYCGYHLLTVLHLVIAPSHLPRAGLGLYACDAEMLKKYGRDPDGRPIIDENTVVFDQDEPIGNGFGGELLIDKEYDRRYPEGESSYTLEWDPPKSGPRLMDRHRITVDAFVARTSLSYSNDPRNVHDHSIWPFRANAYWQGYADHMRALTPIHHGEEILWSYGHMYWEK